MAFSSSKKDRNRKNRQTRQTREDDISMKIWDPNLAIKIALFLAYAFIISIICFMGQFPAGLQVLPNQVSKIRVVAEFPFSYPSKIKTAQKAEIIRKQTAPVYSIDDTVYDNFKKDIDGFAKDLDELEKNIEKNQSDKKNLISQFSQEFEHKSNFYVNPDDIVLILSKHDSTKRKEIFDEGLIVLHNIMRDGIFQKIESSTTGISEVSVPFFYSIEIQGRRKDVHIKPEQEALRTLSTNLSALEIDWAISRAFYRILRNGVQPNLVFDPIKTEEKVQEVIQSMQPIVVHVESGETIIEPGSLIGPDQMEKLRAYHDYLLHTSNTSYSSRITLRDHTFLTFFILFVALVYTKLTHPKVFESNRRLAFSGLILVVNLAIIRLTLELGEIEAFGKHPFFLTLLPYLCPVALAPMIMSLMVGPPLAVLLAVLVSTFFALMLGSVTNFFIISLFSGIVAIYFLRTIRQRSKVVRAGLLSSLAFVIASLVIGNFSELPLKTIVYQTGFCILTGLVTSIIVIGILPTLENLFRFTTNITLLELTDFNHPLLRRLQMEAPGTYHHSLMVANLAERAAVEINANALICRVCCLFHDIGKIVKPDYFVENQKGGLDPHLERNPSMSALVIKSHIKEGVALAKQFKLPKLIIDVIEQHHGTTIIQYFYDKAKKQRLQPQLPFSSLPGGDVTESSTVDESTFRYDGPIPNFKESAIIFFADPIEAASRSLKKITASSIEELIDNIVNERLKEHQLDDAPLSFKELNLIKKSFTFTLLNMFHSRIEYPSKDAGNKPTQTFESTEHESHKKEEA